MKSFSKDEAEQAVSDILSRGVGTFVDPDGSFRKNLIEKAMGIYSKDVVVKFGVDPNRPDIHLGHAVVLRKLRKMQDIGVKVIFLIGDYTAQIGDPTGKNKTRPELEQGEIEKNMQTYLDQVGKILSLEPSRFSWIRNSDWFTTITDLSLPDDYKVSMDITPPGGKESISVPFEPNSFVGKAIVFEETRMQKKIGAKQISVVTMRSLLWGLRHVTLAQLSERDMFQKRIKEKESLFMHEMLYPIFQGIDSDVLAQVYGSCDLEVGGTDQTFNMLMGRKIMEVNKRPPQAVLSFELLVGTDGKEKMSKSLDNYIAITDSPTEMFGKVMSIPDSSLPTYYELCTFTSMTEVADITKKLKDGKINPRDIKMELAKQLVEIYHGSKQAEIAHDAFVRIFSKKELPTDMPTLAAENKELLVDVLLRENIVASKTEFRRLIQEGAVKENGENKIDDPLTLLVKDIVLKIGKHRFVRIEVR